MVICLNEFLANKLIWIPFTASLIAQVLKMFYYWRKNHKINLRHLTEAGGMPSSHSALVSSLATVIGIKEGLDSSLFAVTIIFAFIVMYDAAGVRQAAGKQAKVLNKIINELSHKYYFREEHLRELIGHTPVEVIAGCFLGILVSLILMKY
jgi:acid phosphatase family membrane protein YuiD